MPEADAAPFVPLTPLHFNVLLSVADGPREGHVIQTEIEERSAGVINPESDRMYVELRRLVQDGLLEAIEVGEVAPDGERARYRITALGMDVCATEARRLAAEVETATQKQLIP